MTTGTARKIQLRPYSILLTATIAFYLLIIPIETLVLYHICEILLIWAFYSGIIPGLLSSCNPLVTIDTGSY